MKAHNFLSNRRDPTFLSSTTLFTTKTMQTLSKSIKGKNKLTNMSEEVEEKKDTNEEELYGEETNLQMESIC